MLLKSKKRARLIKKRLKFISSLNIKVFFTVNFYTEQANERIDFKSRCKGTLIFFYNGNVANISFWWRSSAINGLLNL